MFHMLAQPDDKYKLQCCTNTKLVVQGSCIPPSGAKHHCHLYYYTRASSQRDTFPQHLSGRRTPNNHTCCLLTVHTPTTTYKAATQVLRARGWFALLLLLLMLMLMRPTEPFECSLLAPAVILPRALAAHILGCWQRCMNAHHC
jgi:hypothetical protein